jgi:uncharacterized protein with ATP-grasp and redox domains
MKRSQSLYSSEPACANARIVGAGLLQSRICHCEPVLGRGNLRMSRGLLREKAARNDGSRGLSSENATALSLVPGPLTDFQGCGTLCSMLTQLACSSCIIDDLRGALDTCVPDEAQRLAILREAMVWLGDEFDTCRIPSYYITRVHRLLKERAGLEMPFGELRQRCNEAGMAIRERVVQQLATVAGDLERMRTLLLWAIAGNHLDFRTVGTGYDLSTDDIAAQLGAIVAEGLMVDHTLELLAHATRGPRTLYLADNVGEIALDTLLVRELQRFGCAVTVAVKGGPITSDAVWADAHAVGMDTLAPVILSGPDTLGVPLDEMSAALRAELERAEMVISKGQANYYACSELVREYPAAFFCLLRTKCSVAARSLGLTCPRANVAVELEHQDTKTRRHKD